LLVVLINFAQPVGGVAAFGFFEKIFALCHKKGIIKPKQKMRSSMKQSLIITLFFAAEGVSGGEHQHVDHVM